MRVLAFLAVLCLASTLHADPRSQTARAGLEVGLVLATEIPLKPLLAPSSCRWCAPNALDEGVSARVRWRRPAVASGISYGTAGAAAVLAFVPSLAGGGLGAAAPMLESVGVTALVTQVIKFTVGRARPRTVHSPRPAHGIDDDVSFLSGHTAIAFALAASAGTTASLRSSSAAPYLWAGGLALAGSTAYLRLAADEHWFTDVLAGGALGTTIGILIPHLTSGASGDTATIAPILGGSW